MELEGEIDKCTIILGDLNTPLSEMDRSSRQKITRDVLELKGTINQLNKIDIQTSFNDGRLHILLRLTWNIHQNRLHSGL